jgi:hypothetical protein
VEEASSKGVAPIIAEVLSNVVDRLLQSRGVLLLFTSFD